VYRRVRDQGRLAPAGLRYVGSWVTDDFRRCFQVMECEDRQLLAQWMARWEDLIEFEVVPVVASAEAAAAIAPRL
jgi:ferric iron reductase protein FhuF